MIEYLPYVFGFGIGVLLSFAFDRLIMRVKSKP